MIKTNNNDIYNMITSSIFIRYVYILPEILKIKFRRAKLNRPNQHTTCCLTSCPHECLAPPRRPLVFHPFACSFVRILTTYISLTTSEFSQFRQSAKTSTIVLLFPLSPRISPHELLGA